MKIFQCYRGVICSLLGSQLNMFVFYQTPIEVIPVDLFEDTINLDHINLIDNNIKHVERGAFNNLRKHRTFQFNNNPCHSGRAHVLNLITQIESKCIDEEAFSKYKNQFTTTTEVSTTMTTVRNFFDEPSTCNEEKSELKHEIETLKAEKVNWQKSIEATNAKIIELQVDTEKTKNDLNELSENLLKKLNEIAGTLNIVKTSNVVNFNLIDAKLVAIELKLDSSRDLI